MVVRDGEGWDCKVFAAHTHGPSSGVHSRRPRATQMMRNALGAEEGGSGVALSREAYQASVDFWSIHAPLK